MLHYRPCRLPAAPCPRAVTSQASQHGVGPCTAAGVSGGVTHQNIDNTSISIQIHLVICVRNLKFLEIPRKTLAKVSCVLHQTKASSVLLRHYGSPHRIPELCGDWLRRGEHSQCFNIGTKVLSSAKVTQISYCSIKRVQNMTRKRHQLHQATFDASDLEGL